MRTKDLTDKFPRQFCCNFVALFIVLSGTTAAAFVWALSIKIELEENPMCNARSDRRRHSICNAWLLTDTIMSFITLSVIYFEFKIGERDFIRKYRSRIIFAHSFSFEKFALTDSYEDKASLVNIGLDAKLKEAIIREHKLAYLKAEDKKNGTHTAEDTLAELEAEKEKTDEAHIQKTIDEINAIEDKTPDDIAKLEKYKFLQRKAEASKRYPITIEQFIE